jgi:hypothetical protein
VGKLGFIGVAQSAGFKLREIKELIDGTDGLGAPMRSLSSRKLGEVEALLERTKAMKGWLEVAQQCGWVTPAECAPLPGTGRAAPGRRAGTASRPGGRQGLPPAARGLKPCPLSLAVAPVGRRVAITAEPVGGAARLAVDVVDGLVLLRYKYVLYAY